MNFEKLETLFAGTPAAGFVQIVIDEEGAFQERPQYVLRIFMKDVSLIFTVPHTGIISRNRDKFYTVLERVQEKLSRFINEYPKTNGHKRLWVTELSESEDYSWAYVGWKKIGQTGGFKFSDGERVLRIADIREKDYNALCIGLKVIINLIEEAKAKISDGRQPFFNWYREHPARFTTPVEYYDYLVERIKEDNPELRYSFFHQEISEAVASVYFFSAKAPSIFIFRDDATAILICTKKLAPFDKKLIVYKDNDKVYIAEVVPSINLDKDVPFEDPDVIIFNEADLVRMSADFGGQIIFESFESSNVCAIDYSGPVNDKVSTVQEMGWTAL